MQMTGQRLLPVSPQQAWNALNDPQMLKACIPGCESVTETGPNQYEVLMAARIGPVSAKFKGKLAQSDIVEPQSYTLVFDGQGGVAGFGKGKAEVRLDAVEGGTQLSYTATAQVGGKIAQIGSRLVDAAASKIADEFFASFEKALTTQAQAEAQVQAEAPTQPAGDTQAQSGIQETPAAQAAAAPPSSPDNTGARSTQGPKGEDRQRWIRWALALTAAAALMAWLSGKGPA